MELNHLGNYHDLILGLILSAAEYQNLPLSSMSIAGTQHLSVSYSLVEGAISRGKSPLHTVRQTHISPTLNHSLNKQSDQLKAPCDLMTCGLVVPAVLIRAPLVLIYKQEC